MSDFKIPDSIPKDLKILAVDDTDAARKVVVNMLQEAGFTNIEQASDGSEAWKMIKPQADAGTPYGIVISDINMPEVNGIELLQMIRDEASTKESPFLIISTENEVSIILKAVELGASNYLVKPFTQDELLEKVVRTLKPDAKI